MSDPSWRPRQNIRSIAIAVIEHEALLLVTEVRGDDGKLKGWRPLGGTIEFGENARDTVKRELMEETGFEIEVGEQISVMENIYTHEGTQGHEIVFVFLAEILNVIPDVSLSLKFKEGEVVNSASWVPRGELKRKAEMLFPLGLAELLKLK
jgi:ADP-ribose pyrophosphatase YjhB (NUDIX family)